MPNSNRSANVPTCRCSPSLLRTTIIGLVLAALIAFPLPMVHAQPASGTDCGCSKTGPFVDPDPGKAPFINKANGDSAASSPKYRLSATEVGPDLPANVTIVRLADGATVLQATGLFWGFSPDQDRFLIWSGTGSVFQADLYDLSDAPAVKRHTFAGAFTSLRFRFGKDGRFLLMAGLINGGTQVQLEYVNAATGEARLVTTLPIPPTGTIEDDSDAAGWGFGPDPSRIVYSYISGGQPAVAMDNLDDASQTPLVLRQLGASAFWQFSPCGDAFGIVNQTAASQAQIDLWSTRDGTAIGSTAFASMDVSLSTTASQYRASTPGSTADLAANGAGTACVNTAPTADFSISGTLEAGRTIAFTGMSSDADGTIASWSWAFGDGATSSLQNPTHVYSAGGSFNVILTVTDNGGKTADRTRALTLCSAAVTGSGKILYRAGNISGDLYALNMDGSGTVRITNSDQMYKGQAGDGSADADYSPDGSKIAWIAIEINGFVGSGAGLSVSNADGSNKTVLLPYINDFMTISNPRWTPDGRSIAFYLRDVYGAAPRHGIYLIDADGSNMRLVQAASENSANQTAAIAYPGGFAPASPSCGGDGCWTLAVQYNTRGPSYNNNQIYKIQGNGTGFSRVVAGTADHSPRFSPDGTKIAFIRGWSPEVLYVMDAGGTNVLPVGTHPSNTWDSNPIWSPDGSRIAYTRTFYPTPGNTQRDIVVTNADGCHGDAAAVGSPYKNALSWTAGSASQGQGSISGHVFYGGSLPNPSGAGITVTAFWSGGSRSGQTDANGDYRITEIPAGVDITSISASLPGYVWVWPGTIAGFAGYQFPGFTGQAYGVFLGMQPDRFTLHGTVRDKDGNPVPGIGIEASGQPAPVAPVTTGSDGGFSLDLRPRSSYTVKPVTAGYDYTPSSASAWGDYGAVLTQDFTAELIVPPAVTPPILFSSDRNSPPGNDKISSVYAAEPDGNGTVRLTRGPASDSTPAWSPDGNKIVFVRQTNGLKTLHVMGKNGTGIVNLGIEGEWPAWSPGGTKIAFSRAGRILVVDVDGTNETQLTADSDQRPAWSRNGKRIAFERMDTASGETDLYEVEPATGNVSPLLVRPGDDSSPAWSPDGRTLAVSFTGFMGDSRKLYTVSADGETITDLGVPGIDPAWSPDGRLAYTTGATSGIIEVLEVMTGNRQAFPKPQGALDASPDWLSPVIPLKGDLDGSGLVDLADAILALQVMTGMNPAGILANYKDSGVDINSDSRIGLEEALYIIQSLAELRSISE